MHALKPRRLVPLAAVAEMFDRTYYDVWAPDLNGVL